MSSELYDLYQEVILDHNKRPRNFGALDDADRSAAGHNPLCGDRLTVYLKLDNDGVAEISFDGSGCAISKASASIMTDAVKGKSRAEIERLFEEFHELLTGDPSVREKASAELGDKPHSGSRIYGKLAVRGPPRPFARIFGGQH